MEQQIKGDALLTQLKNNKTLVNRKSCTKTHLTFHKEKQSKKNLRKQKNLLGTKISSQIATAAVTQQTYSKVTLLIPHWDTEG